MMVGMAGSGVLTFCHSLSDSACRKSACGERGANPHVAPTHKFFEVRMAQFGAAHTHGAGLQGTAALAAVGMLLGVAFGLSTLITPLYLVYQQQFGFSQITLTLIYAAYAIGNIAALLFFGRVSDRVGSRLIALPAIVTLIVAALVFLFANGVAALYIGRILSGLGIGIASGTGNARRPNSSVPVTRRAPPPSAPARIFLALG